MKKATTRSLATRVALLSSALTAASAILLAGQTPPAQTPTSGQTTFRATANYVSRDVKVFDKKGTFISDLTKKDFQVFEDGVRQTVEYFNYFRNGRGVTSVAETPAPRRTEGLIMPPKPRETASGRIFVVFIDDLHIPAKLTPQVRKFITDIRDNLVHEGDQIAIVSTGYSGIEVNLTYDRDRLEEARGKFMGGGLNPTDIIHMPTTSQGPQLLRYNVNVAFSTAYDLLGQLEHIPNRSKAFIFISGGYDFNPFKDSRYQFEQQQYATTPDPNGTNPTQAHFDPLAYEDPFQHQGEQFSEIDLVRELAELTRAAVRANTMFFTFDPRGLIAGPDIDEDLTADEWRDFVLETQSSLRVLADETGGKAFVNRNDLVKGLKEVDVLMSDYYIIGYNSSNPDPLRRSRKVEIRVNHPDVGRLDYQNHYELKPASKKGGA